jgi:hypothetical protein
MMKLKPWLTFVFSALAFCFILKAQTSTSTLPPTAQGPAIADPNGILFPHNAKSSPSEVVPDSNDMPTIWKGYEVHLAIELGGRSLAETGNRDVYATFVNLQPGVRLMDQSLQMHSVDHTGLLFDDLEESSFGLGGDPNEVVRLRAGKRHWYDFNGSWRRDVNFWDYNLLGNPLNPPTNTPFVPVNVSPALLNLSRKMLDLNLTLRPESALQFVLGYSHYSNAGPSLTTVHEGTEAELNQQWRDISDSYRFGAAWRPIERTRFSYDQFYTHNKSDTNAVLNGAPYSLSNGTPVNLGISFGNNSPCAVPFTGSSVTPTCNLYTGYSNSSPYYTDIPTEQVGFQTSYFRRLHIDGRASYTGAQTQMPNSLETFTGVESSSRRQSTTTGAASVQEITTSADAGVTYEITERLSVDDQFRWHDYRIPSGATFLQSYLFGANALSAVNTFSAASCPPPYTSPRCPQHVSGSAADTTATSYSMFQAQNQKRNTVQLHYELAHNVTAYIGYRFERQDIVVDGTTSALSTYFPTLPNRGGCTAALVNGTCSSSATTISSTGVQINTNGGMIGIAAQPIKSLRLNANVDIDYSDNVFTNIMPRHMQLYRGKALYSPKKWVHLNANARIQEMRNLASGLGNIQHNRSFSFGAVFPLSPRLGIDVNYSYNNLLSNLNICFSETPTPAFATTTPLCPTGYLTTLSFYHDIDHFGSANLVLKPFARTTVTAGYTLSSTNGNNLFLNPLAPLGPAAINYHIPNAAIAIDLARHLTLKAGWNLYDYREKSPPGPVAARNFEANLLSISLRYAM